MGRGQGRLVGRGQHELDGGVEGEGAQLLQRRRDLCAPEMSIVATVMTIARGIVVLVIVVVVVEIGSSSSSSSSSSSGSKTKKKNTNSMSAKALLQPRRDPCAPDMQVRTWGLSVAVV